MCRPPHEGDGTVTAGQHCASSPAVPFSGNGPPSSKRGVRLRLPILLLGVAFAAGCGDDGSFRRATVVNTLVRADLPLIRSRPKLVAGKYATMAGDLYNFYRGSFALYARDCLDPRLSIANSDFDATAALPLSIGDAHPENFGTLLATDGTFAIEPNDFDGADRYPYLWEVRRLGVGMVLASRLANDRVPAANEVSRAAARDVAFAAARSYAETIAALEAGAEPARISEPGDSAIAFDLFDRSLGDLEDREELDELTDLVGGVRRLKRGGIDPDDPQNVYLDLPDFALEALPTTLAEYRRTLLAPPPPDHFTVLDAARELASGVASWPRVRIIILVRGPTDDPGDDVILEMKELIDSGAGGWIRPGVSFDSVGERVVGAARQLWSREDAEPYWGHGNLVGLPVQVKLEAEALKTFRVRRLDGDLGEVPELIELAELIGQILARMHASSGSATRAAIVGAIGSDPLLFAAEQADVAVEYADQVEADQLHLADAIADLGPTLGVPFDPRDEPSPELAALFAEPPETSP